MMFQSLRQVLIAAGEPTFKCSMLELVPPRLNLLDFDGELFYRGKGMPRNESDPQAGTWLPLASAMFR
jgi:hypothetical protein